uniref:Uncharacterized protein n=1 Tax=Anopheles aquasalis TaxID=42839 RepID=T1E957_ANOAQ
MYIYIYIYVCVYVCVDVCVFVYLYQYLSLSLSPYMYNASFFLILLSKLAKHSSHTVLSGCAVIPVCPTVKPMDECPSTNNLPPIIITSTHHRTESTKHNTERKTPKSCPPFVVFDSV